MSLLAHISVILLLISVVTHQGRCSTLPPGVVLPGCFRNTGHGLDLGPLENVVVKKFDPPVCIILCVAKKKLYAGNDGNRCACGNMYGRLPKVDAKQCSHKCPSGSSGMCGGPNTFTIYSLHHYYKKKPCSSIPPAFRGLWYTSTQPERQVAIFTNAVLWRHHTGKPGRFSTYVAAKQIYCISPDVTRVVGAVYGEMRKINVCITLKAGTDATLNATVTRTDGSSPNECDIPESTSKGLYEEFALSERPLPVKIRHTALGCFRDQRVRRTSFYDSLYSQQPMTEAVCSRFCYVRQAYYFSLRDTYWCDCGLVVPLTAPKNCGAGCGKKSVCPKYDTLLMYKLEDFKRAPPAAFQKNKFGVYVEMTYVMIGSGFFFTAMKKGKAAFAAEAAIEGCLLTCAIYRLDWALLQHRTDHTNCYCRAKKLYKGFDLTPGQMDATGKPWRQKVAKYHWVEFTIYKSEFRRRPSARKTKPLQEPPPQKVLTKVLKDDKLAADFIYNINILSGNTKGQLKTLGAQQPAGKVVKHRGRRYTSTSRRPGKGRRYTTTVRPGQARVTQRPKTVLRPTQANGRVKVAPAKKRPNKVPPTQTYGRPTAAKPKPTIPPPPSGRHGFQGEKQKETNIQTPVRPDFSGRQSTVIAVARPGGGMEHEAGAARPVPTGVVAGQQEAPPTPGYNPQTTPNIGNGFPGSVDVGSQAAGGDMGQGQGSQDAMQPPVDQGPSRNPFGGPGDGFTPGAGKKGGMEAEVDVLDRLLKNDSAIGGVISKVAASTGVDPKVLIGGGVGGVLFIITIVICIYCKKKKKEPGMEEEALLENNPEALEEENYDEEDPSIENEKKRKKKKKKKKKRREDSE